MSDTILNRIKLLEKRIELIAKELAIAEQLIVSSPDLSLAKSRMVLEKISKKLFTRYTDSDREVFDGDLNSLLKTDPITKNVPSRILTRMHSIRIMGNLGIHGSDIKDSDAKMVLENLCEIIEWYISTEKKVIKPPKPEVLSSPAARNNKTGWVMFASSFILAVAILFSTLWESGKSETMMPQNIIETPVNEELIDLNGKWNLEMTTVKTSYKPFQGMQLGFDLLINQNEGKLNGNGEKLKENGKDLSGKKRTILSFTGSIQQDEIRINYTDYGINRTSVGQIVFKQYINNDSLSGTFAATAADSEGTVLLIRE